MKTIGGYFGLEIVEGKGHFYQNMYKTNSATNAFLLLARLKKIKSIFLPKYNCSPFVTKLLKNNIEINFYDIDDNFEPLIELHNKFSIYINYFGIKNDFVNKIKNQNVIIDNAQSFFMEPVNNLDTFYSPRKFFGIPDGGYLYTENSSNVNLQVENDVNAVNHLVQRINNSPEKGYINFKENELTLIKKPLRKMSKISDKILSSINYEEIKKRRLNNFKHLHKSFKNINKIKISRNISPISYPLMIEEKKAIKLRKKLLKNKIFIPKYWPGNNYKNISDCILPLPIDHRYDTDDMELIIKLILK